MKHIKEAVGLFIKNSGLGQRQEENFIFENWKSIAGEEIAKQAEPFKMDGKKLWINAENSVILSELTYKKKFLKDRINRLFKEEKVRDIIIRIKQ
jgi:predicted nucleic acid-binding Zn ribbon protein